MRRVLGVNWMQAPEPSAEDRALQAALAAEGLRLHLQPPGTPELGEAALCVYARAADWHPTPLPSLVLVAHADEEAALLGRLPPSDDVLRRPAPVEALLARLQRLAARAGLHEFNAGQPVLMQDALTPCLAANAWSAQVHHQLELPAQPGVCALLVMGLDHFGRFNREHGHAAGDVLLQSIAARCQAQLAAGDRLGRLQGDSFGLLLRRYDASSLRRDADELRAELPAPLQASAGLAWWQDGEGFGSLLAAADAALQRAKAGGRNRLLEAGRPPAAPTGAQRRAAAGVEALTQGGNRAYLEERLLREAAHASRPLSLLLLDPQGLALLNREQGRTAGDRLLQTLAARLRALARLSDWMARPSGGSLALVMPDTDAAGVAVMADRLRVALQAEALAVRLQPATHVPGQDGLAWLAEVEAALARAKLNAAAA